MINSEDIININTVSIIDAEIIDTIQTYLEHLNSVNVKNNDPRLINFIEIFDNYILTVLDCINSINLIINDPKLTNFIDELYRLIVRYNDAVTSGLDYQPAMLRLIKLIKTIDLNKANNYGTLTKHDENLKELYSNLKTYKDDYNKLQIHTTNPPKPIEIINTNQHTHIFKNNAFEVWQAMFNEFDIKESSRSDIKFMFEEMLKHGLIYDTVNQINILDWINETYQMKIEKTSNHSRTKMRLSAYDRAKSKYNK